jgi:hypothetical protein
MKDCERFERTIEAYVAGEPVADDLAPLVEHCRECPECRALMDLHREMADLGSRFEELEEPDFDALRARVLEQVARKRLKSSGKGIWASFLTPFSMQPVTAAALMVAIFFVGIVAGQIHWDSAAAESSRLLNEINNEAATNRSLGDVADSPYTYSNVTFRRVGGGEVALGFDVTRHVDIVEPVESTLVKEVLVHSLLNPTNTGSRLKAVSFASDVMEPKVMQALVFAMHKDENLAVRLKALSILGAQPTHPDVDAAVLATLREDESVQMRMEALDYLAARSVDRELLRRTIRARDDVGDPALMVRLAEYRN